MVGALLAAFLWGCIVGLLTADWVGERTRRKHAIAQQEAKKDGAVTW